MPTMASSPIPDPEPTPDPFPEPTPTDPQPPPLPAVTEPVTHRHGAPEQLARGRVLDALDAEHGRTAPSRP